MKSVEIEKLNGEVAALKEQKEGEIESNDRLISMLKEKIRSTEVSNMEEVELLKVKMAQLHHGDIEGLMGSYESQILELSSHVTKL